MFGKELRGWRAVGHTCLRSLLANRPLAQTTALREKYEIKGKEAQQSGRASIKDLFRIRDLLAEFEWKTWPFLFCFCRASTFNCYHPALSTGSSFWISFASEIVLLQFSTPQVVDLHLCALPGVYWFSCLYTSWTVCAPSDLPEILYEKRNSDVECFHV